MTNHGLRFQADWLDADFRFWLEAAPAEQIVFVAGNHDLVFQHEPSWVPKDLPAVYLQDAGLEWRGLKIWGTPWQPWFFDWAFNLREPELKSKWDLIPADTDILVVHGPPFGYGDAVPRAWRRPSTPGRRRCWPGSRPSHPNSSSSGTSTKAGANGASGKRCWRTSPS